MESAMLNNQDTSNSIIHSQLELPTFNQQLERNTLRLTEPLKPNNQKKGKKVTKKQKAVPNSRKSYAMFPKQTVDSPTEIVASSFNSPSPNQNVLEGIDSTIQNVPIVINSNELDKVLEGLDSTIPNVLDSIDSNELDSPIVSIPINMNPEDAFSDINLPGINLPPEFEFGTINMNEIFSATAATAAVGVLAKICSNSMSKDKETTSKEKTPQTTSSKETNSQQNVFTDFVKIDKFVNLLSLSRSKTQPITPADGNCLFHSIYDQVLF